MKFKILSILFFEMIFSGLNAEWAEQTLNKLTLEEKIGQLFMIGVCSVPNNNSTTGTTKDYYVSEETAKRLITKYHIGGLVFFQGTAKKQVEMTNQFQKMSTLPLLVGQDSEWGLKMRLSDTISFPKNMTLGAISNDSLINDLGNEIGKQCRAIGVHVNFAPVCDINSNPDNPIIGVRSFGEFKEVVAHKADAFLQGLQSASTIACLKHFPGHGDASIDSHLGLPILKHSRERLNEEELYPFKFLIKKEKIKGVMTAHLAIPALDPSNTPASLSRKIITNVLKKELGFTGLIFTDALSMGGVAKIFKPEETVFRAIEAGSDILVCPLDAENSIKYLVKAFRTGKLDKAELEEKVLKILKTKEFLGLHKNRIVDVEKIDQALYSDSSKKLKKALYKNAITVIRNDKNLLPINELPSNALPSNELPSVAIVDIADSTINDKYKTIYVPVNATDKQWEKVFSALVKYETIVLRIFKCSSQQGIYGKITDIENGLQNFLNKLKLSKKKCLIVLCTSPYALRLLPNLPTIVAYENDPNAIEAAMNVLFGYSTASGKLPIKL